MNKHYRRDIYSAVEMRPHERNQQQLSFTALDVEAYRGSESPFHGTLVSRIVVRAY